ncbi:peptidase M23 [Ruegeria pomeroyi]|uniref:Peptidase M23 n=1 Tax=Ruegeria alba TaxID=2916756 RepID=A0ABS9NYA0_9RHOB|nr:hypothetical protein [Ruegeria alba]MCE8513883.1 peptidase M23 [Ruegeria pomeroyi]MCE8530420.1 peptidase M23 [Ruegeria pomeroyi]MCG6559129.1 hypothetical protein [Ruegeria alba]
MTRMLFAALVFASPAMAHTDTHIHAHGTDHASLGVGLALIALIVIALLSRLPR